MLKYIAILGVLLIGKITAAEIVDVEVADPYDQLIEQLQKLKTAGVAFSECAKLFEPSTTGNLSSKGFGISG